MDAVADLRRGLRHKFRAQTAVGWSPRFAPIITPEHSRGGNGDKYSSGIAWVEQNSVQTHTAGPRLPFRARALAAQSGQLLPGLTGVRCMEQSGVLHPGIDKIRIGQRGFEMPHA